MILASIAVLAWAPDAAAQRCSGLNASDLVFTGYSPFGSGVAATATLTYTCDTGVTQAWISISRPRLLHSGGNQLSYDVYPTSDRAASWPDAPPLAVPAGASVSLTAYGFVAPQDAADGKYSDVLFVTLYSGPGQSQTGSAVMHVRNDVTATCTIGAGMLAFGGYDALGANATAPLDGTGTFQVACTTGAAYTVGLGLGSFAAGTVRQMANGAARLRYELYSDPARTSVWSTTAMVGGTAPSTSPITLTVYGRVPAGQAVPPGSYADSVQSTINF
jgi:spore coat protein U-like protein